MSGRSPRQPANMQGLLRYAIEAQTAAGGVPEGPSVTEPLNEENRQWLREALGAMSVNVVEVLKSSLKVLDANGDSTAEEQEQALDQLLEWADNIDVAVDFHKIGGFQTLISCLKSPHVGVRSRTAELVGELTQNHNYFREKENVKEDLVPLLLRMIDTDEDETVRIKSLFGLSCLLRQNEMAQKEFVSNDGFSTLLRAMQSEVEKLKVKASFLMSSLCDENFSYKDVLCDMGFVEQLAALIQLDHDPTHEHIVRALLSLVEKHEKAIQECRRPELALRETLQQRCAFLQGKEESQEEMEYCQELINICFKETTNDDNCAR